jgi:hypothetical protein
LIAEDGSLSLWGLVDPSLELTAEMDLTVSVLMVRHDIELLIVGGEVEMDTL